MKPQICELFKHRGRIYIHCSSLPVWNMFVRDLEEQGFAFGDGVRPSERLKKEDWDIIAVQREYTICFCGFASHVRCGSLRNPVYVKEDHANNCTRVDYARFVSGEEEYVIKGPESVELPNGMMAGSGGIWD